MYSLSFLAYRVFGSPPHFACFLRILAFFLGAARTEGMLSTKAANMKQNIRSLTARYLFSSLRCWFLCSLGCFERELCSLFQVRSSFISARSTQKNAKCCAKCWTTHRGRSLSSQSSRSATRKGTNMVRQIVRFRCLLAGHF